tara:strand:+ start:248 stop:694 length:447 start_codon:yes stop_codon:yes gene_type:complete
MAKTYQLGDDYKLYYRSSGTYASPTWSHVAAADSISVDFAPTDIAVNERGIETGHLQGKGDPSFSFSLMEDTGDTNVEALIDATLTDATLVHLAVSRGDIATSGVKYFHMECALFGGVTADQGGVASYDIEARRHANSDNGFTRATVS